MSQINKILSFNDVKIKFSLTDYSLFKKRSSKSKSGIVVLESASGFLNAGDVVHLMGENGAGKTTLLKTIMGIFNPYSGVIDITKNKIGLFEESVFHPEITLEDNFLIFSGLQGRSPQECRRLIPQISILCSFPMRAKYKNLSQGEKALFALTCAGIFKPTLIILDEPFSHMDEAHRIWSYSWLKSLALDGTGIIYTSHMGESGLANQKWLLQKGHLTCGIE